MKQQRIRVAARVLVGFVVLLQLAGVAVPHLEVQVAVLSMFSLSLVGGVFAMAVARGADRLPWRLVAAGQFLTIAANQLLSHGHVRLGAACGFVMYASFALAVLTFPTHRMQGWQRMGVAGEVTAVLGCGFMYVWYFVLQPHLMAADAAVKWPVTVGFPVGDLFMFMAVALVVLRGGLSVATRPMVLMLSGLALFLFADVVLDATGDDGLRATASLLARLVVMAASACVTLAAMWRAGIEPAGPAERRAWTPDWFSYVPYGAIVFGLGLMVAVTVRDGKIETWGGLVLGLTAVTGGVAVRQVVSLRDSRHNEISDPLTGLVNRAGLYRRLLRALRRDEPVALLLLDLDGFKNVNDAYGHNTGDLLLAEFASVLIADTRGTDVACRLMADEFAVLQREVTGVADAVALARRIQGTAATSTIRIDSRTIAPWASVGVAVSQPGDTVEDLRHRAEIALYQAKRTGNHAVVAWAPGMLDRRADDAALGRDLADAVALGQLRVLYQPMVDLASGRPCGVEALVRWEHPTRGLVSPLDFIPVAERTGAVIGIGRWVLREACREVRSWPADVYVSVNLSPRQLQEEDLVGDVLAALDDSGLPPSRLVLEVTESVIVDDRSAIPAVSALRAHGIRIAIDDFGTGYSSLQYLSRLPVDILKIDRSFVAELDGTRHGSAITEAVIRLADILDLTTVAEGIETPAQEAELRRLGARTGQGYFYAKPLPAADASAFTIADRTAAPR